MREPEPFEPEQVETPEPAVPDDGEEEGLFESWSEPEPELKPEPDTETDAEWSEAEPAVAETTHANDDASSIGGGFIEMEPEVSAPPATTAPSSSTPEPSAPAPSFGRRPGRVKRPFRR
jgi:hypothetical protein